MASGTGQGLRGRVGMETRLCVCVLGVLCVRVGSVRKAAAALWVEPHYKQFQMWRLTGA